MPGERKKEFECVFCGTIRDNNEDDCPKCGGYGWKVKEPKTDD
jgi:hypothetical protein